MHSSSVRPTDGLEEVLEQYGNMLFRYAFMMLGTSQDAEDVVQDTLRQTVAGICYAAGCGMARCLWKVWLRYRTVQERL